MGIFVLAIAIVLVLLGLASLLLGGSRRPDSYSTYPDGTPRRRRSPDSQIGIGARIVGVLLILVGLLMAVLDSSTVVAPRELAVQTAFGKIQGPALRSGWHWVAPWNHIETFDASVQTLRFSQAAKGDDGTCITVRLANNTTACVDTTVQWAINHEGNAINDLYLKYRTFDNIHDNLVKRQLQSALNEVFGRYDPLAAVGNNQDTAGVPNTRTLQDAVGQVLAVDLRNLIVIESVTIPLVHFDGPTEDRLKAFQQSKADTRIAEQQKETAKAQAEANRLLAEQTAIQVPGVQYQNCLNLTRELAQRDQLRNLPPTWNCNQTQGGGVLVQTK